MSQNQVQGPWCGNHRNPTAESSHISTRNHLEDVESDARHPPSVPSMILLGVLCLKLACSLSDPAAAPVISTSHELKVRMDGSSLTFCTPSCVAWPSNQLCAQPIQRCLNVEAHFCIGVGKKTIISSHMPLVMLDVGRGSCRVQHMHFVPVSQRCASVCLPAHSSYSCARLDRAARAR